MRSDCIAALYFQSILPLDHIVRDEETIAISVSRVVEVGDQPCVVKIEPLRGWRWVAYTI